MLRKIVIFVLSASLMLTTSCNKLNDEIAKDTPVVLKLAEVHLATFPSSMGCQYFADLVHEKTDGRVRIDVYTQGQLGTELETIESVQDGTIDFGRINCMPLAEYSKNLTPVIMPYVFENSDHFYAALNGKIGDDIRNDMVDGFEGLAWYYSGSRCFYFNKEVHSLEDITDLKIRVQDSSLMKDLVTSLGGIPVILDWDSIYPSIENGEIDGAENDILSYETAAHNIVAPNYILDHHTLAPSLLLASEITMSKLSKSDAEIIRECAMLSSEYEFNLWEEKSNESKENLIANGSQFIELPPEALKAFQERIAPIYEKYASDYQDEIEQLKNYEY